MTEATVHEVACGASPEHIARMMVVAKAFISHESEWYEGAHIDAFVLAEEVLQIYPEMTWSHGRTRLRKAFKRAIRGHIYSKEVRAKAQWLLQEAMTRGEGTLPRR